MQFPIIIRYKDDKSLVVCLTLADIAAGMAFTILAEKLRIVRKPQ